MKFSNRYTSYFLNIIIFSALCFITSISINNFLSTFSIDNISHIILMVIIFISSILGLITCSTQLLLDYIKKNKNLLSLVEIIFGGIVLILTLSILGINSLEYESLGQLQNTIGILMFLSLANIIYILVISFSSKNKIYIQHSNNCETSINSETETYNQEKSGQQINIDFKSILLFFKGKNGKKVIIGVVVCLIVLIAYNVYDQFFNKTTIDLLENVEIAYTGYSGDGMATISNCDVDYDINNENMANFVSNIEYDISPNQTLSNGDKVTVTAKYSQMTADKLKIKVNEDKKEFTVSGLIEKYQSAKDIDKNVLQTALAHITDEVNEYKSSDDVYDLYKTYYLVEQDDESVESQTTKLACIYKHSYQVQDFFSDDIKNKVEYVVYSMNIDSSLTSETDEYVDNEKLYNEDTYEPITKDEEVFSALRNAFNDSNNYIIEEINNS